MSRIARIASAVVFVLVFVFAGGMGTNGAIAQTPPDVSVAIAGIDGTAWQASAIGGHTVAGSYRVANDNGAFTWDGSRLHLYPVVVFSSTIDERPDNAVVAVNSDGVAVGANELNHMSSSGLVEEDRAARFANGYTTFISAIGPGVGLGRATAVDALGNVVGYTADGLGFYATSTMARTTVAGLTTAAFGAAVAPSAMNGHDDIAGTSTTLQTFGNRFDAPSPSEPHVFLAAAGAAAAPAQDLGRVPHCQGPTVAGLSNARTIAGMCTSDAASHGQVAWEWSGAFGILAALPGDDAATVSAVSPDGIVLGSSLRGDRKTAVFWRDGRIASIASLTTVAAGDAFEEVLGGTDDGWFLVRGKRGATATDFLVVPRADSADATRVAAFPAGPAPRTTDAPPPLEESEATPGPSPSIVEARVADAMHAPLRIRWSGESAVEGPVPMASDGKRLYLAVAQSVEAFDVGGTLVWKRAFPGASALAVASGTLVSRGPKSTIGLDAASGALRWSVPHVVRVAAGSSFAVGDGFVGTASGDVLQILDVTSGRLRAHAAGAACTSLSEAGRSFACADTHEDYTQSITVYDAATGRAMVTLPGVPPDVTTIGSTFYAYDRGVIAIHPSHRTYDVLTFPGAEDADRRAAFDGNDVVLGDGAVGRRYRLDAKPSAQRPVPFPIDSLSFAAGDGVVASFEGPGKPLTVVAFDPAGKPSAVVYSGLRSTSAPVILIRQGLAFASTPGGVTVVDLARRRVVGSAALTCDVLEEAIVAGGFAAVSCQVGASHRVSGIDIGGSAAI